MDAYAIGGVESAQIEFLAAPDHLSPTHTYGVTFERGTSVRVSRPQTRFYFGNRKHRQPWRNPARG